MILTLALLMGLILFFTVDFEDELPERSVADVKELRKKEGRFRIDEAKQIFVLTTFHGKVTSGVIDDTDTVLIPMRYGDDIQYETYSIHFMQFNGSNCEILSEGEDGVIAVNGTPDLSRIAIGEEMIKDADM